MIGGLFGHFLAKAGMIFVVGAGSAVVATQVVIPFVVEKFFAQPTSVVSATPGKPGLTLGETTNNSDEGPIKNAAQSLINLLVDSVADSPALAPLFKTKKSVEESVEAVSTLPEEQKKAVCQELCGPVLQPNKPTFRSR